MEEPWNWDFFIAHAGADKALAEELYDMLRVRVRAFLDSRCVLPGDDWDITLAKVQRQSLVTVVLISTHTEKAYYQREEIAAAIALARDNPATHRIVPVFLDSASRLNANVPYGLRLKYGFTVSGECTLRTVAEKLMDLVDHLRNVDRELTQDKGPGVIEAGPYYHVYLAKEGLWTVDENLSAEDLRNSVILPYLRGLVQRIRHTTYGVIDSAFVARLDYYLAASFPQRVFEIPPARHGYLDIRWLRIYKTMRKRYWGLLMIPVPHPLRSLFFWADECTKEEIERVVEEIGFTASGIEQAVPALRHRN